MPGKTATLALCLTEETPARLRALVRSRTTPAHHVKRSPIILHLVDQHDATEIAAKLRIDRQWVTCFQRRVRAVGPVKAIDDLPRSGRQPDITKAARTWLIGATCVNARSAAIHMNCGRCAYWQRTHARGPAAGHTCHAELAPSTVYEVLNSQPVKPHNVRYTPLTR